ncbi:MAG: hypothetical protein KAU06_02860 [Candidatus Marinimicrobia bacterium]|nr:hypothetical protein [Candidatus Neomarinimicrobiota bacterium]
MSTFSASIAQEAKIDSLKQLLAETADDSNRAEILIKLGSLVDKYDPEKSINYSLEALELFSKQNDIRGRARTLNKIGYNHWQLGKFLETINYY